MNQFVMSQYANKGCLYKAKAGYWQAVANRCIEQLAEGQILMDGEEGWYWDASGDYLDEGL